MTRKWILSVLSGMAFCLKEASAAPVAPSASSSVILYDSQAGTHINILPMTDTFPRSDINFVDWSVGQYSGLGTTDFFLYHGSTHKHPLIVSNRDEVIVSHEYENEIERDAYDKLPSPLNVRIGYGRHQAAAGTAIGVQSGLDIFNEATPLHGKNEFFSYYAYVRANNRGHHPPGQHYWVTDFHLQTPYAPRQEMAPELGIIYSGRIMNMSNGTEEISSKNLGSFGQSLVATPMLENELQSSGIPLEARNYPVTALLALAGFSGDRTTYDGILPSAGPAATYALRIGGGGGSPYIPVTSRSNFRKGIGVYDWSDTGVDISHRLPNATGPGLRNVYTTELGGAGSTEQPYSLVIHNEIIPQQSILAGEKIGDGTNSWILSSQNQQTFSISYQDIKNEKISVSDTGIGFMGHSPEPPMSIHPKFDLAKRADPQELAKAYNSLYDALERLGLIKN